MDYDELKKELKAIMEVADSVPDRFKEKCFEILLNRFLGEKPKKHEPEHEPGKEPEEIPTPAQIRVLMQRQSIAMDDLKKVLMYADGDIHFLKEPPPHGIAKGQIWWTLLLALKNGILTNNLSADPEAVRSICQEKGYYDPPNFAANFKTAKHKKLFKNPLEPHGEPQLLSNDGQAELAKLIKTMAGSE